MRGVEASSGVGILADADEASDVDAALVDGARVCFTGSVVDGDGRAWGRDDMEQLAREHGLVPVANVTKTRCDVLVCAEAGTQSRKAKTAVQYGKPIVLAEDFLAWARGRAV